MTNLVAVFSDNPEFAHSVRHGLSAQGFRVIHAPRPPQHIPEVNLAVLDVALFDQQQARQFAIKARMLGSEVILCGHWTRPEKLERLAQHTRLRALTYPCHPQSLLEGLVLNPFNRDQSSELQRQLADIAGHLYAYEGVAVQDHDSWPDLVHQRTLNAMADGLANYQRLLQSERDETHALAHSIRPTTAPSLFQPSPIFQHFSDTIAHLLPKPARGLIVDTKDGLLTLSFSLLNSEKQPIELYSTCPSSVKNSFSQALEPAIFDNVPREFRHKTLQQLSPKNSEFSLKKPVWNNIHTLPSLKSWGAIDEGTVHFIALQNLFSVCSETTLEEYLAHFVRVLAPNGWLILTPGESLLRKDPRLVPQNLGALTVYRRRQDHHP